MPVASFVEILELIGIVFSAVMLLIGVVTYFKNTRIREAELMATLYANFQRDRQAMLDNPKTLAALAEVREETEEALIRNSIISFLINQADLMYTIHKYRLVSKHRVESAVQEWEGLFSKKAIVERWPSIRTRFDDKFRQFIETNILK